MRFFTILLLLLAPTAFAEENEGLTIYPHLGKTNFADDIDDDNHWGVGVGYRFNNPWGIELTYQHSDADLSDELGGGDVDAELWNLSGLYHFKERDNVTPYLSMGVANGEYDIPGDDDSQAQFNAGVGLKWFFSDRGALRGDFKIFPSDEVDNTFSLGVHFALGGKEAAPAAPAAEGDADRDGVVDSLDQCPGTPAGVEVDNRGCPLDDDGDGVPNYKDQCPNTTNKRARVDSNGCYMKLSRTVNITLNVEFDFDSHDARPEHAAEVKKVADFMEEYPHSTVVMEGHTDSKGPKDYNQGLSERRANTIADMLTDKFGISEDRVSARGHGEVEPIDTNETAAGRQNNRRVVAVVEGRKNELEMKQ